ncbi:MAG: hypothetical protein ACPH45_00315, partial [Porticoccaceae bacterium]
IQGIVDGGKKRMITTMNDIEHKGSTVIFGSITSLISQLHRGNRPVWMGNNLLLLNYTTI